MSDVPGAAGTPLEGNVGYFFHFGLIVTGEGERDHLPKLFKSLMATGICTFSVIKFIGQRAPITSEKKIMRMVGSGKIIPSNDEQEIGIPARKYLNNGPCYFIVLIDDLEDHRRNQAQKVIDRYRLAFNTILTSVQNVRAAVHLLVNILEAYYLADAAAVNTVLQLIPPLQDHTGDVEEIPNPKAHLKKRYPAFEEAEHGGNILDRINIEHVLSQPDTCAWLRTLFAWCVNVLKQSPLYDSFIGKYLSRLRKLNHVIAPKEGFETQLRASRLPVPFGMRALGMTR